MGIYLMKKWLLKFMSVYNQSDDTKSTSESSENQFTNFYLEFVSFVAKNQFKQEFQKYLPEFQKYSPEI